MEALIIQTGVRHGKYAETTRSQSDTLAIGRDYSNDLVLTDPHVAAKQLKFEWIEDTWWLNIIDSANGIYLNGKAINESVKVSSGDQLRIGRTKLRLFTESHEVAPTKKLLLANDLSLVSIHPLLSISILIGLFGILFGIDYFTIATDLKWKPHAHGVLMTGVAVVCWAAVWAIVGLVSRQQASLWLHIVVASVTIFVSETANLGFGLLLYPLHNSNLLEAMYSVVAFITLSAILFCNLSIAVNTQRPARIAIGFTALVFAVSIGLEQMNRIDAVQTSPSYSNALYPPVVNVFNGTPSEKYFSELEAKLAATSN